MPSVTSPLGMRPRREVISKMRSMGTGAAVKHSGDVDGRPPLAYPGGSVVRALRGRARLSIGLIDGPDHTFTPVWSHAALITVLDHVVAAT